MDTAVEQRPLGELFADLARSTGTLVRQEVELVKTEMTHKAKIAIRDALFAAFGAAVTLVGISALVAAAILGLGVVLPMWLAALSVGGSLTILGVTLAIGRVRAIANIDPVPRATVETLREDKQWLDDQLSR